MKNILFALLLLLFNIDSKAEDSKLKNQSNSFGCDTLSGTDPVLQYLRAVNLSGFLNIPVNSFLATINRSVDSMHVTSCASTKDGLHLACYLQVEYGTTPVKDFTIRFYVRDYTHMNRYSGTRNWNPNLMKLENAYRIEVYYLWDKINSASL
jgi:hypothetical protein